MKKLTLFALSTTLMGLVACSDAPREPDTPAQLDAPPAEVLQPNPSAKITKITTPPPKEQRIPGLKFDQYGQLVDPGPATLEVEPTTTTPSAAAQ